MFADQPSASARRAARIDPPAASHTARINSFEYTTSSFASSSRLSVPVFNLRT